MLTQLKTMSVQVKTPTKTQFEHLEIQCGERNFRNSNKESLEGVSKSKDDFSIKGDSRSSQPWNRKRRYSQSYHRDDGPSRFRKRLKSSPYFNRQLPTRFLNGGSIEDPLNLNGLESSELGKQLNSVTPQSSPLPVPRRQSVEVRIPVNVTDPLNLTADDEDGTELDKLFKKKKPRHNRHKKKDEMQSTSLFSPPKNIAKDKNLMEALKIEIEPESIESHDAQIPSTSKDISKPRQFNDKIVSPVVRQISPKSKNRRRKSDNKPDPSSASRSLLNSSDTETNSSNRSHKKFKHPKTPQKQQAKKNSGNRHQSKFIYGNYNRYYGYRNPSTTSDQRLLCLNQDWFDEKVILDIGCNVGHVTLAIARDFHPKKIVGIDIDQNLIGAARKNIRYYMSTDQTDMKKFPISTVVNYGPILAPPVPMKEKNVFPHNIMFMQGNYVLECDEMLEMQKEEYDVIMAFSVTKWIHFNWGDEGLKRFFKRVFRQLRPGGRFILEPQPWSSYKKKKKLTDDIFKTYQSIKLRPEQFNDFLLSRDVGFSTCNKLKVPNHSSKGFCRPIMVYTKSDTVQNSPYPEIGYETPVYSSYVTNISQHLQPLTEVSESSSCSSCDSSLPAVTSSTVTSSAIASQGDASPTIAPAGFESSIIKLPGVDSPAVVSPGVTLPKIASPYVTSDAIPSSGVATSKLSSSDTSSTHFSDKQNKVIETDGNATDVKDTKLDVKDANFDVKDANLDVKDAKLDVKDTNLDVKHTQLDVKHTQLDVKGAELDFKDIQLDVNEAQLDVKEAQLDLPNTHLSEEGKDLETDHKDDIETDITEACAMDINETDGKIDDTVRTSKTLAENEEIRTGFVDVSDGSKQDENEKQY